MMRPGFTRAGLRAGAVCSMVVVAAAAGPGRAQDAAAPAAAPAAAAAPRAFEATSCAKCHAEGEGALQAPVLALRSGDVHAAAGITCVDCHGGDASLAPGEEPDVDKAKSVRAGYIGKPKPRQIPQICGRCHANPEYMRKFDPNLPTDQLAQYHTSVHGKRLAAGEERVATCVSCHGAHGVLPVNDPRAPVYPTHVADTCAKCHSNTALMTSFGHHTDPPKDYRTSVHGKALYDKSDLSAPTCNDCHGSHGASPPGITSIAQVCGVCHVTSKEFFAASPHKVAFDVQELHECTECHSNHAIHSVRDAMVGSGSESVCVRCHSDGDAGLAAAAAIRAHLDSLSAQIAAATDRLDQGERGGMEVSEGRIRLQDAHTALIQSRDRVHTLDPARVLASTAEGSKAASEALQVGVEALRERDVRRRGLAASLVFIAFACIGLYAMIRKIDRKSGL